MAILFDLDGTLLDTSLDFHLAINRLLTVENKPLTTYEKIRNAVSFGSKRMLYDALNLSDNMAEAHEEYITQLLPKFLQFYEQTEFKNTFAFPGIQNLLDTLDTQNITWGIVTNKHQALTTPLLKHANYLVRSACVVCGDTTNKPKPAPDPLLHACDLLKIAPEQCIYIGDAATDIQAGKAAKMRTIAAAFGFVPSNVNVEDWQADVIVNHPNEIYPWIQKWLKEIN